MSVSNNFPSVSPTLNLNFAAAGALDARITFTRASDATYFNSAGVLTTASSNVARFDYNPSTLQSLGLLIEEQRTNSIRNNTMQGAVAGTPGTLPTNWAQSNNTGLTANVVGTGTENGITYIDLQIVGTSTGTGQTNVFLETGTGVAALTAQVWSYSSYLKVQAGSLTNIGTINLVLQENNSGGSAVTAGTQAVTIPTTALGSYRPTFTRTLSGGATVAALRPYIQINIDTGLAVNVTIRIGLPQLEQGAFATSVIPTTTTALTRNADVATMTGTNFSSWYNASEGTIFAQYTASANANTVYSSISNGATNQNSIYFDNDAGVMRNVVFSSNSAQAAMSTGAIGTVGAVNKIAAAYKVNDFAVSRNGAAAVTDTSGAVPVSPSQLDIGRNPNAVASTYISGYIQRIAFYPQRLANAQLQALTL